MTARERLKSWAHFVRRDALVLYLAARDPRVPWYAKALAAAAAAYAFSPIDLIPDFIPVIGYLDDLIILPLAITLVVRMIPMDVMTALRAEADGRLASARPRSLAGAVAIVIIWMATSVLLGWAVYRSAA